MPQYLPAMDAYIASAQPFAQPILLHLRDLVHAVCPAVEEKMKWSMPHFDYRGMMMAHMAAFKQHASFGFWSWELLNDTQGVLQPIGASGMGNLGKILSLEDLPPDAVLEDFIRQHMALNDQGIKPSRMPKAGEAKALVVPDDLAAALAGNPAAQVSFGGFTPGQQREYVDWITEAKTAATRAKRLAEAVEWMSEGKTRNWKYGRK